jgi:PiT family inorganic phosphate transporter
MSILASVTPLVLILVAMALAFDFLNGLHDAANSIATVVTTRLLTPVQAVIFAAFFNFSAYWLFGLKVAETVGKGIVNKDVITPQVIFGALVGAMTWNVITWWKGILLLACADRRVAGRRRGAWRHGRDRVEGVNTTTTWIVLADGGHVHVDGADAADELAVHEGHGQGGGRHFQEAASGLGGGLFDGPRRQ